MKTCPSCKRSLTIDNFSKNTGRRDGVQTYCKECAVKKRMEYYYSNWEKEREAHKKLSQKIKNQWIEFLKSSKCVDCGESRYYVLDLDHVKGEKEDTLSNMIRKTRSWEKIKKEIDKCEVRCANCHRARHYLERNMLS